MRRIRRLFHLGWGPSVEEGVAWEIEHHLEECVDDLMAEGLTREEAEAEAERRFGDVARIRRELRGIGGERERARGLRELVETLAHDVRYGLRSIRRNRGFAAAVVLTLGLGIGANSAMFSVVDALLLRPLPYAEPEELVVLQFAGPADEFGTPYVSWEVAREVREKQTALKGVLVHTRQSPLFTGGAEPTMLGGTAVTPEFEETLGVAPLLGRGLAPDDAVPGAPPVVLLGHGFWRSTLGGDPGVLGTTLELDGVDHTVIGVMPGGFKFPEYSTTSVWIPIQDDGTILGKPVRRPVQMLARVPGPIGAAEAPVAALVEAVYAADGKERTARLSPIQAERARSADLRRAVWLLVGAVVLILLVAGVNMANLLLVRGSARVREIAVRLALGATRGRLVRQLATEAVVLALLSGGVAVLLALAALRAIQGIIPESITFFAPHAIEIEERTLLFTFAVAVAIGLVFGLVAAIGATRIARPASGGGLTVYASATPSRGRLRRALVVAEVALSVILLAGAALLINSFVHLVRVDPGMRLDGLAVLQFDISAVAHPDADERAAYVRRMEERITAIPGVAAITRADGFPTGRMTFAPQLETEEDAQPAGGAPEILPMLGVAPDFFDVAGTRLLAGRAFTTADTESDGTVIIDEDLAHALWPTESPVGRRFRTRGPASPWLTVVGVAQDIKLLGPDDRKGDFEVLYPAPATASHTVLLIRTVRDDPRPVLAGIRAAVHEIGPDQPIGELAPARTIYAERIEMPRFLLVLMSVLATVALSLSAIGIFGVLAYTVSRRTREFGVRMALGGRPRHVRRLVLTEGLALAGIGAALGLAGALAAGRFVRALLFGVEPADPVTLGAVIALMLCVALAACLYPAHRATRADPAQVLRTD